MRSAILITSEQTIPNLLFIRELGPFDRYLFITTSKMEQDGRTDMVAAAAELPRSNVSTVEIVEDSLDDIEDRLRMIDFDDDEEFVVNMTGGTKIMSIGVFNFFRSRKSEIYYLPIGKNSYQKIHPRVTMRETEYAYRIGLSEYLCAHGARIANPDSIHSMTRDRGYTNRLLELYVSGQLDRGVLRDLREENNKRSNKKKDIIRIDDAASDYLLTIGFTPDRRDQLSRRDIKYLTGGWFEEWTYSWVRDHYGLDDSFVGCSVEFTRRGVRNEFDVMFVLRNALYVIECKTSLMVSTADPDRPKDNFNEFIYKISALEGDFGLRIKSFLFTLGDPFTDSRGVVNEDRVKRAKWFNVSVAGRNEICGDLAGFMSDHIRKEV